MSVSKLLLSAIVTCFTMGAAMAADAPAAPTAGASEPVKAEKPAVKKAAKKAPKKAAKKAAKAEAAPADAAATPAAAPAK